MDDVCSECVVDGVCIECVAAGVCIECVVAGVHLLVVLLTVCVCSHGFRRSLDDQTTSVGKEVKGRNHLYYQVLIDARDCPHIVRLFRCYTQTCLKLAVTHGD
jgi:hypothetical protein